MGVGVRDGYLLEAYAPDIVVFIPIFTYMCVVYMNEIFCIVGEDERLQK